MTTPRSELDEPGMCAAAPPDARCRAELGWGLMIMIRAFKELATEAVATLPGGLRGHLVLTSIAEGQPPSQAVLAGQIGVDRTAMTYLIDELEQAGYLERRPDPADRRARLIFITPAGTAALGTYRSQIDGAEARLLAGLSDTEATQFRSAVERIARTSQDAVTKADVVG